MVDEHIATRAVALPAGPGDDIGRRDLEFVGTATVILRFAGFTIVTEPHAARKLQHQGFTRTFALRTWESQVFEKGNVGLTITALPGKHAPRALAPVIPPVMGSLLDFHEGDRHLLRVYITGDTLMYDRLEEIPRRFPAIDL